MKTRTLIPVVAVLFAALTPVSQSRAQSPLVNIETVLVGDPGNPPDSTGYGSVAYAYRIGKYEVSIAQYTTFLNSVAKSDPYGLYSSNMAMWLSVAGIARTNSPNFYRYSPIEPAGTNPIGAASSSNRPIAFVSWLDAARFCNWLHNGATNGASTETGAYTLNGATSSGGPFIRNPGAKWWIPSEDEWHKAAYYRDAEAGYWFYPTQSYDPPGNFIGGAANQANSYRPSGDTGTFVYSVTRNSAFSSNQNYLTEVGAFMGSPSRYGTFDQAGNLSEFTDSTEGSWGYRLRGGSWAEYTDANSSTRTDWTGFANESERVGFRVATTADWPPPTSVVLSLQKTTNLSSAWQGLPITPGMMTQDGEIIVGPITNTNEFYRLKIRTVVD